MSLGKTKSRSQAARCKCRSGHPVRVGKYGVRCKTVRRLAGGRKAVYWETPRKCSV